MNVLIIIKKKGRKGKENKRKKRREGGKTGGREGILPKNSFLKTPGPGSFIGNFLQEIPLRKR